MLKHEVQDAASHMVSEVGIAEMTGMNLDAADAQVANGGHVGFFDSIKNNLSPRVWADKIRDNKQGLIEIGIYVGLGFIIGFLLKKYSKLIFCLVVGVVILLVLQHMQLISLTVHWDKLKDMLGASSVSVPDASIWTTGWQWVVDHALLVGSFVIGFVCGLRLG